MWLVLFILLFLYHRGISQVDKNNYGPYSLNWGKLENCKGPKQANCSHIIIGDMQNESDVIFHMDFPKDCLVTTAKITLSTLHNNKTKNKLWDYQVNKPCKHFVLGPILTDKLNVTGNCKVNKGQYDTRINLNEQITKFLGSSFFYGTYLFKTVASNKNSNIFCILAEITMSKIS